MPTKTSPPIDFYFDFSSPYGYLAAHRIDAVAAKHGRDVAWRPFLLGVAFKTTGAKPFVDQPLKSDYGQRDMARTARLFGLPFTLPSPFPFAGVAASRAFYWLSDLDRERARALALAIYDAAFGAGRDMSGAHAVADAAAGIGLDRGEVLEALQDPAVKDRLRSEVDAALARGVFGSPFMVVDGEPFWGADRLDQVDRWLETGGW